MVVTFFSKTDRVPKNRTIEPNQEVMLIYRLAEGENFQFAVKFLTRKFVVEDILARIEEYAAELKGFTEHRKRHACGSHRTVTL